MNPYNYQTEVSNLSNLTNREEDIEEIEYYLEECSNGNLYNIAITGESKIGKSSLLNVSQRLAESHDVFTVDFPINEINVIDEIEFYRELFETVLSNAVDNDELQSNWLDRFRDAVSGVDKEAGLGVGSTYFKISSGSNQSATPPRREIIEDLRKIATEMNSSSVGLFFDDAELLLENETLFRKLYSIINASDAFFLVISGTQLPDAIPDEVGPIHQSFQTVELSTFEGQDDTEECLLQPLPETETEKFDDQRIQDIHRISGGHPFEIKLIAHHMYKKYQRGASSITLDSEVLVDVARSLESIQKSQERDIPNLVNQLSDFQVTVLSHILEIVKGPKKWLVQYSLLRDIEDIDYNDVDATKKRRARVIEQLLDVGILSKEGDIIEFAGETFDRLYSKYHAADRGMLDLDEFQVISDQSPKNKIYSTIINLVFESAEVNYRFITRFDVESYEKPDSEDLGLKQNMTIHRTGTITIEPGEWETIVQWKVGEYYEDSPTSTWFRCNLEWAPTGFSTKVILLDEVDRPQEHLKKQIEELSHKLRILDYNVISENEMVLLKEAESALNDGELAEAEELLNDALDISPLFDPAWRALGLIYSNIGKGRRARVHYRMGIAVGGLHSDLPRLLTESYESDGMLEYAADFLEYSIEKSESVKSSDLLYLYRLKVKLNDLEEAGEVLHKYRNQSIGGDSI